MARHRDPHDDPPRRRAREPSMISRTPTLAEWPLGMVRFACHHCERRGQYCKDTLIAKFGGDVLMPDLRHMVANAEGQGRSCQRRNGGKFPPFLANTSARNDLGFRVARALAQ